MTSPRRIQEEIEKLSIESGLDRFRDRFDDEIRAIRNVQTDKFRRVVQLIQDHNKSLTDYRTTLIAALVGILAALLGGVAGGVVTLLSSN